MKAVKEAGPGLLWSVIICTGGCDWQHMNAAKYESSREQIAKHRRDIQRIWMAVERAGMKMHRQGGMVATEWPANNDYWRWPPVIEWCQEFGTSDLYLQWLRTRRGCTVGRAYFQVMAHCQ